MRLRHFRNNTELSWIASDEKYDFNFQEMRLLRRTRRVMPGDSLVLGKTFTHRL
jgi:hypothetical protein